jgi:hypothetical protein
MTKRRVVLSDADREFLRDLAVRRVLAKRVGIRTQTSGWNAHDRIDRSYPHAVGLAAELAYARETGLPLDESIRMGGDRGDFLGVEVKATTHTVPPFVLAIKQEDYCVRVPRAYVLARVEPALSEVEFLGSISREKFDRIRRVQMGRHCANWAIGAERLAAGLIIVRDGTMHLVPFDEEDEPP